jgi:cyclohexanone monooxygenase
LHEVEVKRSAQDAWIETLLKSPPRLTGAPDCTPGYYNNEGQAPTPIQRLAVGYPAGASAYFRYLDAWRATGDFTGLEFR